MIRNTHCDLTHNTVQFPLILRPTDVTIPRNFQLADVSWRTTIQANLLAAGCVDIYHSFRAAGGVNIQKGSIG